MVVTADVIDVLRRGELRKGDALAVARIAAISAVKKTPDLIPLCHPLAITGVDVTVSLGDGCVELEASVRTADRTGIEMEALTAVTVGALNIIDMVKALDRGPSLSGHVLNARKVAPQGNGCVTHTGKCCAKNRVSPRPVKRGMLV